MEAVRFAGKCPPATADTGCDRLKGVGFSLSPHFICDMSTVLVLILLPIETPSRNAVYES